MNQTDLDAVVKFGEEIINPKEGVIIFEPDIEVSSESFITLFDLIKGDPNSPLEVGIVNLLPRIIINTWPDLKDCQKAETKAKLLEKCSLTFHEKSISRFADSCIAVYKFSGHKWDKLVDFIMNEGNNELNGFMFVRFMSTATSDFIKDNNQKIIDKIVSLLPVSSISVQTGLITILSVIDSRKALAENKELYSLLWSTILNIFTVEPNRIGFLSPLINEIFMNAQECSKTEAVSNAIAAITDLKSSEPILQLIPFLNTDDLFALLQKLHSFAQEFISINNEIPKDLISAIDSVNLEGITKEKAVPIIDFIKPKLDEPAGLALLAPFAAHIADVFGKDALFDIVRNSLKDTPIKIALGLAIFECISGYSEALKLELPDDLMYSILTLFSHDEQFIRNAAYSTISSLIENNVFIFEDQVKELLKVYPNINSNDLILFFKQLRRLLRVEGISPEVVHLLFKFSMDLLTSNKDKLSSVLSQSLSIICAVASQECDELVLNEIKTLFPISISLLKSDLSETFVYSSRALVLFTYLNPQFCRRSVLAVLPRIIQISTGECETNPKIMGNVAVAMASILVCLEVKKDFGKCLEIIKKFVNSNEQHLINDASTMAEILRSTQDEKLNFDILDILLTIAIQEKSNEILNSLLNAIRKIIKSYPVDKEKILPLLRLLVSGGHPIYDRKPPSMLTDKSTKIYSFLMECCDKYSDLIPEISYSVIQWFTDSPLFMTRAFIPLVSCIVANKTITGDDAKSLIKVFINKMSGSEPDVDELILGNIIMLLQEDSTLYNIQKLTEQLIIYWKDTKGDEISAWRAQVGSGILVMCSLGGDVSKDLVQDILACYPFDEEFGKCREMSEAIVKMFDSPDKKWEEMNPTFAKSFADLLVKPQDKLDEYSLPRELILEMKRVLKTIIRSCPTIEREITRSFGKNRQLQNRFKSVLK